MVSTQIIVLSKQPYKESALLLAGLSPDFGKLNLVAHGAQKLSAKEFPAADLFRELDVEFDDQGKSDLFTAKNLELTESFDTLAENPLFFKLASKIGQFLLKNAAPGVPQPYTYDALRSVLTQLSSPEEEGRWSMMQCSVVVKITYLYENGLLPEAANEQQNDFLENLVAAGIENSPLPECNPAYWKSLNDWLSGLLDFHHLAR